MIHSRNTRRLVITRNYWKLKRCTLRISKFEDDGTTFFVHCKGLSLWRRLRIIGTSKRAGLGVLLRKLLCPCGESRRRETQLEMVGSRTETISKPACTMR